nr:hypothetical protein [Blastomonas sp. CCH5-A3]
MPRNAGGGFDRKHVFSPDGAVGPKAIMDGRLILPDQAGKR